jgi:hypothetical protein
MTFALGSRTAAHGFSSVIGAFFISFGVVVLSWAFGQTKKMFLYKIVKGYAIFQLCILPGSLLFVALALHSTTPSAKVALEIYVLSMISSMMFVFGHVCERMRGGFNAPKIEKEEKPPSKPFFKKTVILPGTAVIVLVAVTVFFVFAYIRQRAKWNWLKPGDDVVLTFQTGYISGTIVSIEGDYIIFRHQNGRAALVYHKGEIQEISK